MRARAVWIPMLLTLGVAFLLTLIELPEAARMYRPDWVALVVVWWIVEAPDRIGLTTAWISGLLLDAASGTLLGQHAFALAATAAAAQHFARRIRVQALPNQMVTLCVFLVLYRMLDLWIRKLTGQPAGGWSHWGPVASTVLLWPLLQLVLHTPARRVDDD